MRIPAKMLMIFALVAIAHAQTPPQQPTDNTLVVIGNVIEESGTALKTTLQQVAALQSAERTLENAQRQNAIRFERLLARQESEIGRLHAANNVLREQNETQSALLKTENAEYRASIDRNDALQRQLSDAIAANEKSLADAGHMKSMMWVELVLLCILVGITVGGLIVFLRSRSRPARRRVRDAHRPLHLDAVEEPGPIRPPQAEENLRDPRIHAYVNPDKETVGALMKKFNISEVPFECKLSEDDAVFRCVAKTGIGSRLLVVFENDPEDPKGSGVSWDAKRSHAAKLYRRQHGIRHSGAPVHAV